MFKILVFIFRVVNGLNSRTDLGFQDKKGWSIKEKQLLQIGIHIVLTNYKYIKSLFINKLSCNHLLTKIKIKKKTQNNIVF